MNIQLNFEINEKVLKQFGIDMDSKAKQELKVLLLESAIPTYFHLASDLPDEEDVADRQHRELGLVKALMADE